MSPVFWFEIGAYSISTVLAATLALIVVGTAPRRPINLLFAMFTLLEATWSVSSLVLRLNLWLDIGNPPFFLELAALAFASMGSFLLMFTARYVERRTLWPDIASVAGLAIISVFSIPLFHHQIISNPRLPSSHVPVYDVSILGFVAAFLPVIFFTWSLVLFWKERKKTGELWLALSVFILTLGFLPALAKLPLQFIAVTTPFSIGLLGYAIVNRQLLNPLKELNVELENRVAERTSQLERAYNEVEKKVQERTFKLEQEISEREQAESALRISEERLQDMINNAVVGVYQVTKEGKFLLVNPSLVQMFGYESSKELMGSVSNVAQLYVNPQDRQLLIREMENGDVLEGREYKFKKKDGEIIWLNISARATKNKEGETIYEGFMVDSTDRKDAEEALRRSEAHMKVILSAAPVGIGLVHERVFAWVNDEMHRMVGYSKDELVGQNSRILFQSEDEYKRVGVTKYEQVMKNEIGETESQYVCKDGSVIDVNLRSSAVDPSDLSKGVIFTAMDISERKKAERALRASEEKYRNILESIGEGYFETDLSGKFTFVNRSECEMLGYSRDECIGMNNMAYTTEETSKMLYRAFNEIYTTGKPSRLIDYEIIRKDGETRIHELSAALMFDPDGKPVGFRGVSRDITETKRAEEEKRKLEKNFYQAQKMNSLGTLAGGIAHDFNNLLMGIQGRSSLMLMDIDSSHPHFEHLKSVEEYIISGANLTKQLLGFARGGKYEVKPVDINELVKKSTEMFGRTRKEIRINEEYEEDIWTAEADVAQIEQVLLNLYVNAWQAMPGGGIIHARTKNIILDKNYVEPYGMEPGRYVRISVTDSGVGMDQDIIQRIFDPFFTTKEMGRGTGLGLASAYGIIRNHKGIINAYSEKGIGTTFNIYLPASDKVISEVKRASGKILRGTETVLMVDDETMITDVGREMMEKLGYQVVVANGGKEALEIFKENKNRIDMVILDMIMPDLSGGETYDRLKEINPNIKVLLSSGYSINGMAEDILGRGCDGFVQKPYNVTDLSIKVREILDRK